MSKVLPLVLIVVIAGVLAFTMLSPKEKAAESKGYLEFLPSNTIMLLTANAPLESVKKVDFQKYSEFFQSAGQVLPFDFTDPQFYRDKGFDFSLPLGMGIGSIEKQTMIFFCGVQDDKAFSSFLQETAFAGRKINTTQVGNISCFSVQGQFGPSPDSIYFFKDGYFVLYASSNPLIRRNLAQEFEKDVLNSENKLSQNLVFQEAISGIKDQGDIFFYMDYPSVIKFSSEQTKRFQPEQSQMMKNLEKIAEDFTSLAFSLKLAGSEFQMHSYMGFQKDSELWKAYQGKGTAEDLLQQLPSHPLVCAVNATDMQKSWEIAKPTLDMLLSVSPLGEQLGRSVDEFFSKLEGPISKELGLNISVEKDILQNIQGTNALVLYNLPTQEKMQFDLLLAARLNNASKMANLLQDTLQALQKKYPDLPLVPFDTKGIRFSVQKLQPEISMEPVICIVGDYLLIASRKELVEKLNQGKGGLLENIKNQKVLDGFKKGFPTTGYVKLGELVEQILNILPPHIKMQSALISNYTKHFQELVWTGEIVEKGMYGFLVIKSDGDFLGQIFDEIMLQMSQGPK